MQNLATLNQQSAIDSVGRELASSTTAIELLLNQVQNISQRYQERAEATGENFNVFEVLGISRLEVKTHSKFLAELLNPGGRHGMKDKFLKAFIRKFNIEGYNLNEVIDASVKVEEYTGFKDIVNAKGGRIDIVVKPNRNAGKPIVIENKIDAPDQEMQLLRYKNNYKDCHLIYMTLNGEEPGEHSAYGLKVDEDFHCISYRKDIMEWLEECHREAVSHPLLRETLMQYINVIKILTHQTINEEMEKEVVGQIIGNLNAASAIVYNWEKAKEEIFNKWKTEIDIVAKEFGILKVDYNEKEKGFYHIVFKRSDWEKQVQFVIKRDLTEVTYLYWIPNNYEWEDNFLKVDNWLQLSWQERVKQLPGIIKDILKEESEKHKFGISI